MALQAGAKELVTFDQLVEECIAFFRESAVFSGPHGTEARTLFTCSYVVKARVVTREHVLALLGEIEKRNIPMPSESDRAAEQLSWDGGWLPLYTQLIFMAVLATLGQYKQLRDISAARASEFNV